MRVLILLIVLSSLCIAQQSIGPGNDPVVKFALELSASPPAKHAELIAAHPELLTPRLRQELIQLGNQRLMQVQYDEALQIYRLTEKISDQIGDKEGVATAWLNIGSVYYFQGNYDFAADHYRKSETLFSSLGNTLETARSHFGIALTYQAQRKPAEALKGFEESLKMFEAGDHDHEVADTLASIGGLQYELGNYEAASKTLIKVVELKGTGQNLVRVAEAFYMQHDYAQALVYYLRAMDLFIATNNFGGKISAFSGAANSYYHQRNYDKALEYYQRSLELEQTLIDQVGVATRLQSIGNVHRMRGDYASALENYFKSLAIGEKQPGQATVATTLGSIGLVRSLQGDNAQAVDYFDRSLKAFQTSGDQVGMARMLSHIGNARYIRGEYDQALEAYEKSRDLHQQRGDHLNRAHVLLGIGTVLLQQQKYPPALQGFHEALAFYTTSGRKADMADAFSRLAMGYRRQGDFNNALQFAESAVKASKESEAFSLVVYSLTELGKAQNKLGRKKDALNAFTEAIQVQRSIRVESGPDMLETERSGVLPYLGAMEMLIDLNQPAEALIRADEAKMQRLRELLQQGSFTITKGMAAAEREQELKLLGDLTSLKAQLTRVQDPLKQSSGSAALRTRVTAARSQYEAFRKRLYTTRPQLAVFRGEVNALGLNDLKTFLTPNTTLIEFVVTDEKVFLFVVTANAVPQVSVYLLSTTPSELTKQIASLRQSTDNSAATRELYDKLLKPAEAQLADKTRLIVAPDGVLWDVPFESLQPAEGSYLIDRASVSYAISFSALREMRKRRPTGRARANTLLAFVNPTITTEVTTRLQTAYEGLQLETPSPESTDLQQIYGPARSRWYTGPHATKERLKTDASLAGVLHFESATILDHAVPMYSTVVLSPDQNLRDDGLLKLWEVTNLNSNARVVVIPHSKLAKNAFSSNALMMLNWAWFIAGTPAVVINRGEDNPAFALELHQRIKTGEINAELLRQAMLKSRSPRHGAGYMLLGK